MAAAAREAEEAPVEDPSGYPAGRRASGSVDETAEAEVAAETVAGRVVMAATMEPEVLLVGGWMAAGRAAV